MCGIVGYIGEEQAAPILLNGLQKLEYRGYDSAGVAVYNDSGVHVVKSKGRLSVLDGILQGGKELPGTVGIGHTRWATHGAPSDVNSHPQVSDGGLFAVVHNGIIENYLYLKNHLIRRGVEIDRVNVGNVAKREGSRNIKKSVNLTEQDIADIQEMIRGGHSVTAQMIPNESDQSILNYLQ